MVLRHLNAHDDIAPPADRRALHAEATLPADGLFVGTGWHALELDGEGRRWRWIDAGAQIVVTNPSGTRCRLRIELLPGPGQVGVAPVLVVRDAAGAVAAEAAAPGGPLTVTLPITPGPGTIFTLGAAQGGTPTPDDPRILNFRVFAFAWEETPAAAAAPVPLPEDGAALRRLNAADDIGPAAARDALHASGLHASGTLPADGLFVGPGWHPLERDDAGARWRWLDGDAQIVVTRPSGARRRLRIDLVPGPGVAGFAPRLTVRDAAGTVAAVAAAPGGPLTVELPLVPGPGTVFTLGAAEGGRRHPADPRVLNFRVFAVGWADDADAAPADRTVTSDRG
jgi:hypothetical protein